MNKRKIDLGSLPASTIKAIGIIVDPTTLKGAVRGALAASPVVAINLPLQAVTPDYLRAVADMFAIRLSSMDITDVSLISTYFADVCMFVQAYKLEDSLDAIVDAIDVRYSEIKKGLRDARE